MSRNIAVTFRGTLSLLILLFLSTAVFAEQLFSFRNGLVVRGSKAEIATLEDGFGAAAAGQANVRPIWLIDDGLRRIYIHGTGMVDAAPVNIADLEEPIEIFQAVPLGGSSVKALGTVLGVTRFNKQGRRTLTMRGADGPQRVYQGITELNSRYAKVEALKGGKPAMVWDMRLSTRTIDSESLKMILDHIVGQGNLEGRLRVVRFFIAAERYGDAWTLLSDIINDFPGEADFKAQLATLVEKQAEQLLDEAKLRAESGQINAARQILTDFPLNAVSRLMQIEVKDTIEKLDETDKSAEKMVKLLREQVSGLDAQMAGRIKPLIDEIEAGLSDATIKRLSDYAQFGESENVPVDSRVALAISGWLLGNGSGEQNLNIAVSLIEVRELVAEYLASDSPARRKAILDSFANLEGAEPQYVDRMLPLMVPPLPLPEEKENADFTGMFEMDVDGDAKYVIQLPPEYDPLREYPCVVALHESRSSPYTQINWWCGDRLSEQFHSRVGPAARHGFIVVAPIWGRDRQRLYEYTPAEHRRVLVSLRDAMRRSSIDADRVFITGHGEGGTAAWDMALAHPDIWAGMVSLSGAPSDKRIVPHYKDNSRYVPLYMVMGEKDGNRVAGTLIDDYMTYSHNAMVVMYRGRGRDYFYEETPRIFEWMKLPAHRRGDPPTKFEVSTMREGDQFFWWVEVGDLKPAITIDPILWEEGGNKRIAHGTVSGSIGTNNLIRVYAPSDRMKVMLRPIPGSIDLNDKLFITFGKQNRRVFEFDRSLDVMLEDARRRADRKRPFWMVVESR